MKQARYLKFKWLNKTWTHCYLVCKQTLNHLLKRAKWLSKYCCRVNVAVSVQILNFFFILFIRKAHFFSLGSLSWRQMNLSFVGERREPTLLIFTSSTSSRTFAYLFWILHLSCWFRIFNSSSWCLQDSIPTQYTPLRISI